MPNKKDPKQNILDISASLIARKGFAAVGVREIAKKSKVNISMISYYFGGKTGILKAINEKYFQFIGDALHEILNEKSSAEIELKKVIRRLVRLMSEKEDLCRVAIIEMPFDVPEIAEFKLSLVKQNLQFVGKKLHEGFKIKDRTMHIIIAHAFMSLIYSNFLFGKMNNKATGIILDEKFYDKYSDIITTIFLNGINGIKTKIERKEHTPPTPSNRGEKRTRSLL